MPNSSGTNGSAETSNSKSTAKSNTLKTSSLTSNGNTPSKIPVYSAYKRLDLLAQLKQSNFQTNGKHSLSAHHLSDLPEDVKLMHMVHCHYNHSRNLPRSKTHEFIMRGSSLPSTSACTSGACTPNDRRSSNASSSQASSTRPRQNGKVAIIKQKYEEYLPLCEMQKGLEKGEIVEGILRINPKNYNEAYISAPEGGLDIFIGGLSDRNRALNGDLIAVKLSNMGNWTISVSSVNTNWNDWEAEFRQLINSMPPQATLSITIEHLKKILAGQDFKKIEIALKGNRTEDLKTILKNEFTNVPVEIYGLELSVLKELTFSCKFIQKSGKVVNLKTKNHTRIVGGTIQMDPKKAKDNSNVRLLPNDIRVPHVMIPFKSLPLPFIASYEHLKDNLFLAKITEWDIGSLFPKGEIIKSLGEIGNIEAETEILLTSNDIDTSEFPDEALQEYNLFSEGKWTIPSEEYTYRRDFREECVFTIDPQSARDLDDAISLKILSDDLFEIGVHIADVSYFIRESTLLDSIAKKRATSVYLANKVIPMLPHLFCQNLCSLNPGEDKLTFSAVFKMDSEGNVHDKWIGRTIINSCAKLSYEHAQKMIDATSVNFESEEYPQIFNKWSLIEISSKVKMVNSIAQKIRKRRFSDGSLRLDKTKISFLLNDDGLPISFSKYVYKDSNRLIEELMLLANKAVAERVYDCFAQEDRAFLRGHPPPNLYNMNEFVSFCKNSSIKFDISNSLSIYNSLQDLEANPIHFRICSMNLIKSMKLAFYKCVKASDSPKSFHHYALNFDKYTHFTSPIRRYADVIVHRLLATSFGYKSICTSNPIEIAAIAENCNTKKLNAYVVSEKSSEIYLKAYINSVGSLASKAVVCNVYDHSFDVLILNFDLVNRVYLNQLPLDDFEFVKSDTTSELKLKWQNILFEQDSNKSLDLEQTIYTLLELDVLLSIDEKFNYTVLISHPNGDFIRASKPNTETSNIS